MAGYSTGAVRHLSPAGWALLAFAWAALVWWLLTAEALAAPPLVVDWVPPAIRAWPDKVGHAALFLVQAWLVARAARERLGVPRALLLALSLCVALGAATELRQRRVPGRDADVVDLGADLVGAGAALPFSRRRRARARG